MALIDGKLTKNLTLSSLCEGKAYGVQGKIYIGELTQLFTDRKVINPFQIVSGGAHAIIDFSAGQPFEGIKLSTIESTNIDIIPTVAAVGAAGDSERFAHSIALRVYGDEIKTVREQLNKLAQGRYFVIVVDGEIGANRTLRLYGATSGLTMPSGDMNNMNDGEFGGSDLITLSSADEFGNEIFYPQLVEVLGAVAAADYITTPLSSDVANSIANLDANLIP